MEHQHELPSLWKEISFQFKHPFGARVVGPPKTGKSEFVIKLLEFSQSYMSPRPTKIYWAYGEKNIKQMQQIQERCPKPVHFIKGLPDIEEFSPQETYLLILDNLTSATSNFTAVSNFFKQTSHHKNISVILILEKLYHVGKSMRDISLNSKYTILFENLNKGQIKHLGCQVFSKHPDFLNSADEQATRRPYGYIIIDFDKCTPNGECLKTGIFIPEVPITYRPI